MCGIKPNENSAKVLQQQVEKRILLNETVNWIQPTEQPLSWDAFAFEVAKLNDFQMSLSSSILQFSDRLE